MGAGAAQTAVLMQRICTKKRLGIGEVIRKSCMICRSDLWDEYKWISSDRNPQHQLWVCHFLNGRVNPNPYDAPHF